MSGPLTTAQSIRRGEGPARDAVGSQPENVLLRLENVGRVFQMGEVTVEALRHVTLDIYRGEVLVMVGPSGSGKTTLLNVVGGMDTPTSGRVLFGGRDLATFNARELTRYRRDTIGFVFQFYNLIPNLTARENIMVATEIGRDPLDEVQALEMVGLAERMDHFPAQLSGGEQQRVAIARAIAKNPDLLLCDEPTGALDFETGKMVLGLLARLRRELRKTVIIITHNMAIGAMADRMVRLRSGDVTDVHVNEEPTAPEEIFVVSILNRKLRREFRQAALRLLAITGIIAVGVGAYVEMDSCHQNLVDARDRYYAQCRMADFWIDLKRAPLADLAEIAALPGISEIRPRIQFFATVDLEGATELLNGQIISLPERRQPILNDIQLKSGGYFTDTRDNEVIVNDAFARKHKLQPGGKIHLILNNAREELLIVGTAISSEFVYLVGPGSILPDPEHFGVFYLKHRYAEQVFNFEGAANQVVGRLTPDARSRPDELLRQAELRLEDHGVLNTLPLADQPSNRFLGEEIKGLATFTRVLPTIFLAVAAFVLNILMTRWTEQQRTTVGTLKAQGYSNAQVFGHFLKFGLVIGLLGGVAGCVLGFFLAEWVTSFYKQFYELPDLHNRFYLGKSLAGLGVSLGFALLGTAQGARGVLKLRPAEAMRPKPPRRGGAILLEHVTWLWSRLSFAWRLGLRDVVRSRARTLAGLFAAAMGTCILITGFMMQEAMKFLVDFQFLRVQRYDLELAFKDERTDDALREVRRLPGVDHAEPVLYVPCTFIHGPYRKRGAINGLASAAWLTTPRDGEGRRIAVPPDGLAMSRALAERLHVSAGETIVIRPNKGLRQERTARVAHIIDGYIGMTVYADNAYLNRLVGEESVMNAVQLQLDPRRRREFYRELKDIPAVESVYSRQATRVLLEEVVIKTQKVIIGILVGFAGMIFFGSLLNASLVSLAERLPEVAMLRVLGYGPWEVGGMFLRESMLVNLAGTLAGLPLGYGLATAMVGMYENEMFRIPVVFTAEIVAKTLIAAVVFGLLAHLFIQRSIHKMDWLEALKVKE